MNLLSWDTVILFCLILDVEFQDGEVLLLLWLRLNC